EPAAMTIEFEAQSYFQEKPGSSTANISGTGKGLSDRRGQRRVGLGKPGRPSGASESAVEAALKWMARHQNYNGSWSFDHTIGGKCSGFANPGDKQSRMGATGLALLAFLGAGYTHTYESEYQENVRKGLKYLVDNMDQKTGRMFEVGGANHEHMYCHGIAACALAEAYGMTLDNRYKRLAQLGLDYIVAAQHPINGGWLYTPRAGGDTSVVGWQIMALKSGLLSYMSVPGKVGLLASRWLDSVQSEVPDYGGVGSRYGYRIAQDRQGRSGACTAIGLLCRNYLGTPQDDAGLVAGVRWISAQGPARADMYFNYYASMVMYQNDGKKGDMWIKWHDQIMNQLVAAQVTADSDRGSWYFAANHGDSGGRLYNTALACMTLEVPYRFMSVYKQDSLEEFPLD
ncbi:MAG: terpene cyclase/mutase family protein, partial [Planctomycetales bacterium]